MKRSDRQTDSVSVVLFMWSMSSVLLAAYGRWRWRVYMTRASTAAEQRLKAPVLHSVNNRKLVTVEFTVRPDEAQDYNQDQDQRKQEQDQKQQDQDHDQDQIRWSLLCDQTKLKQSIGSVICWPNRSSVLNLNIQLKLL